MRAPWLIACEKSGVMRRALRRHGVEAWSCDLEEADDGSEHHMQMDALVAAHDFTWGGMIAHPECRFLSASGLHWNVRPGYEWRAAETEKALDFALALWRAPVKMKLLENPRGKLGEWYLLWRDDLESYLEAEGLELFVSDQRDAVRTWRSPSRDSWPAGLRELRLRFEAGDVPTRSLNRMEQDRRRNIGTCRVCTL